MKKCTKCGEEKAFDLFYAKDSKCKECRKLQVRENRLKNIDYYREFDRQRANLPHRVEARVLYEKTEIGKAAHRRAKDAWSDRNSVKRGASYIVNNAVRDGRLIKKYECEECGVSDVKIHGHHDDYALPLNVRWLCSPCHRKWHKENGPGSNS